MNFGYVFTEPYVDWLRRGVAMTLFMTVASGALAAALALAVLRCRISGKRTAQVAGAAFVLVFRNLPLVPFFLFLTAGLPTLWQAWWNRPFSPGFELHLVLLGLSLNTAAYVAEILRAGVGAVPAEQIAAARTLGLPPGVIRRRVVFPQAARIVAPALASRFIHNMKNSTLAIVVPLPVDAMEVVGQAGRIAGQTFAWAEPLAAAACVHLVLALGVGGVLDRWASRVRARVVAEP